MINSLKKTLLIIISSLLLISLSSCENKSYEDGYDEGYDDGYSMGSLELSELEEYNEILLDERNFYEEEYLFLQDMYDELNQTFISHLFSENNTYIKESQLWVVDNFEIKYYTEIINNTKYLCYSYRLVNEDIGKYYEQKDIYSSYIFRNDCPLKTLEVHSYDGTSYNLILGDIYGDVWLKNDEDYISGEYVFDKIEIDNNVEKLYIVSNINDVFYTSILSI